MSRRNRVITAKQVADFRKELGISQTDFAAMLGIECTGAKAIVSKLELGQRVVRGPMARLISILMHARKQGQLSFKDVVQCE